MGSAKVLDRLESAAVGQKGLITATQAKRDGVERFQLLRLEEVGVVSRIRHGVYSLPSAEPTAQLELRAAWLHLEPTRFAEERLFDDQKIAVSHLSAAEVHGLGMMVPTRHEFTSNYRKQSSQADIQLHRGSLDEETVIVDGMLVTSISRTVSDLAKTKIEFGYLAEVVVGALARPEVLVTDLSHVLDRWAAGYGYETGSALLEACRAFAGAELDHEEQLARLSPALRAQLSAIASAAITPNIQFEINKIVIQQLAQLSKPISDSLKLAENLNVRLRDNSALSNPFGELGSVPNLPLLAGTIEPPSVLNIAKKELSEAGSFGTTSYPVDRPASEPPPTTETDKTAAADVSKPRIDRAATDASSSEVEGERD